MPETYYNIYCDESCHLEKDGQPIMLLGGIWCPYIHVKEISKQIREIKSRHGARGEVKWSKVSSSREEFFLELLDYFFGSPELHFRCLVVENKQILNHDYFNQGSHDSFYYKMYYYMLRNVISPQNRYNIYIDIKDTRSAQKVALLKEILCHSYHDFSHTIITNIQQVQSKESEILQLADLLIGAISYKKRGLYKNAAKKAIVQEIMNRTGLDLMRSNPPWEEKFNLFMFMPTEVN